jgi:tetratricopeptide (TPR) repeat protein
MKEKHTEKHGKIKTVNVGPAGEETNTVAKIQAFIEDNRNLVIGVSAGIIILVVGIFLLNNYMQEKEKENNESASFALSFAQELYLGNDYEKALYGDSTKLVNNRPAPGLVEIVEKYEDTKPAKVAALYAGDCYFNLGDYDKAAKYFEIATESESPVIKEGAYAGLAVCSEIKGDFKQAADNYEKAIAYAKTTEAKNRYEYFQAICYEKLGETEKAELLYKKIIAEDVSEFVNLSKGALARIGTKIE